MSQNQQVLEQMKEAIGNLKGYQLTKIQENVQTLEGLIHQLETNEVTPTQIPSQTNEETIAPFTFEGIDPMLHVTYAVETLTKAKEWYDKSFEFVGKQDRVTQDLLHKIELNILNEEEMLSIANEIKKVRVTRRNAKDFNDLVKPLSEFAEKNEHTVTRLTEIERTTRNFVEWKSSKRKYIPRELQEQQEDTMVFQAREIEKAPTALELAFQKANAN